MNVHITIVLAQRRSRSAGPAMQRDGVGRIAQPTPGLGHDQGIAGIMGVVTHRSGEAQAAVIDVDQVTQHGHVLGTLVDHPRRFILVKDQLHPVGSSTLFGGEVRDVDHSGVDDAALLDEQVPTLTLKLVGALPSSQQCIGGPAPPRHTPNAVSVPKIWESRRAKPFIGAPARNGVTPCRISQPGASCGARCKRWTPFGNTGIPWRRSFRAAWPALYLEKMSNRSSVVRSSTATAASRSALNLNSRSTTPR